MPELRLLSDYQPSGPLDCAADLFAKRLESCAGCEHRRDQLCALDGAWCTVRARRVASVCHAYRWEQPAPVPQPLPTTRGRKDAQPATAKSTVRVAIISPQLARPGGAEQWMTSLGRHLPWIDAPGPRMVVSSYVVTAPQRMHPDAVSEMQQFAPVVAHRGGLAPSDAVDSAVSCADVVIVWGMGDVRHLVRGFRGPVVWVAHGECDWTRRFIVEAQAGGIVTHWAGVSRACLSVFPERLRPAVRVLENGVEPSRLYPVHGRNATRRQWDLQPGHTAVAFIGRLAADKRPDDLARALVHLPESYVGVWIGGGKEAQAWQRRIDAIVPGRTRFPGVMHNVGDALAAADVIFQSSPAEGFSLSRCEAWLANKPVVSTPTADLERQEAEYGPLVWRIPFGATSQAMARQIEHASNMGPPALLIPELLRGRYNALAMSSRWRDYLLEIIR